MSDDLWYDRDGQPIDTATANRLLGDKDYKRVALTRITSHTAPGNRWIVSTVWLGLDHGWDGKRAIFETMVFGSGPWDQEMTRHATEAEAKAGHDTMVSNLCQALTMINTVEHLNDWPQEHK